MVVKNIYSAYGFKKAEVVAHIYPNKEIMQDCEPQHSLSRGKKSKTEEASKEKPAGDK